MMTRIQRTYIALMLMLPIAACSALYAQTDSIHGVVNRYTRVTFIECTNNSALTVENPTGFSAGDKILIVQIQGAGINTSDNALFGSIGSYNDAGNYELATIRNVIGYTFELTYELARSYTLSGGVQVVRVPQYVNVVITDSVMAKPWDGLTGGIVALIASGTVTMNADISATGAGFRDGLRMGPVVLPGPGDFAAYRGLHATTWYPSTFRAMAGLTLGSMKGEGIHIGQQSYYAAKGAMANGGGGGNGYYGSPEYVLDNTSADIGAGGGGGSNDGAGGRGGGAVGAFGNDYAGIGGCALPYSNGDNRIFLGGGGGWGGLDLSGVHGPGMAGGGIVFIQAATVDGRSHTIAADGGPQLCASVDSVFPGGGGGGGGVLLLDVGAFSSTTNATANGGNGQNVSGCLGPGGGGGGGCIWLSGSDDTPANLTPTVDGGNAGTRLLSGCGSQGAGVDGDDGSVLTDLQVPVGTVPR